MSDDLLPSMIPFMGCVFERAPDGVEDEGLIEVDKWHDIAWEIKPNMMRVLVDGRVPG